MATEWFSYIQRQSGAVSECRCTAASRAATAGSPADRAQTWRSWWMCWRRVCCTPVVWRCTAGRTNSRKLLVWQLLWVHLNVLQAEISPSGLDSRVSDLNFNMFSLSFALQALLFIFKFLKSNTVLPKGTKRGKQMIHGYMIWIFVQSTPIISTVITCFSW